MTAILHIPDIKFNPYCIADCSQNKKEASRARIEYAVKHLFEGSQARILEVSCEEIFASRMLCALARQKKY